MAKHVPNRMCVACREMKPKSSLVRVVSHEGALSIDEKGKAHGRGAYVCKDKDCVDKAFNEHRFEKNFKRGILPEERERLRLALSEIIDAESSSLAEMTPEVKTVITADGKEQTIRVIRKGGRK